MKAPAANALRFFELPEFRAWAETWPRSVLNQVGTASKQAVLTELKPSSQ